MLLAIDTATQLMSIALHDGGALIAECTLRAGVRQSALLAPLIKRTMAQTGLRSEDLTALAVAVGPGSYTGTRIGLALAKGMAAARDLPLAPANTLETLVAAQAPPRDDRLLIATVSAGRQRVIWAPYHYQGDAWLERRAPQISDWGTILAQCDHPIRLTGEISPAGLDTVNQARKDGARIELAPAAQRLRRAGYLAEIAWRRLREGDANDFPADRVTPIYLKRP